MKACFMGLGYIGLPTAIIAAKHGIDIIGVDINPQVVEVTNQGKLHIIEPCMEEMLQEVIASIDITKANGTKWKYERHPGHSESVSPIHLPFEYFCLIISFKLFLECW